MGEATNEERVSTACWVILHAFLLSTDFFQHKFFRKILSGLPSECQTVWIQLRPNKPDLGPNCLQRLSADNTCQKELIDVLPCVFFRRPFWLPCQLYDQIYLREAAHDRDFNKPKNVYANLHCWLFVIHVLWSQTDNFGDVDLTYCPLLHINFVCVDALCPSQQFYSLIGLISCLSFFYVIILNLDQCFRCCLKYFLSRALVALFFSRVEPFVQFLYRAYNRNISLKLFWMWTSGSGGNVVCLTDQSHLCKFSRRHYEEHFWLIILNLDQWFIKCLKDLI